MNKHNAYWAITVFCLSILIYSCKHDPVAGPAAPVTPPDTTSTGTPCDPDTVYFQNTIFPLLNSSCAKSSCHDAGSHAHSVYMDNYLNIFTTAGVVPFNPDNSNLYQALISTEPGDIMPPGAPLSAAQIAQVRKWILQGAKNNVCTSNECDSVNVTWSGRIKPMIDLYCVGCHGTNSPGGGVPLLTYTDVKNHITQIYNTITWNSAFPMPKGQPKFSQCKISQFHKWIQDGALEN